MGYDVHITRARDWTESEARPIPFEDWQACVAADPSLLQDPDNGPHDFLWKEHPEGPAPLWWWRGEVYSKNPDGPTMSKMMQLAESLGAYLVGDEGERYERKEEKVVQVVELPPHKSKLATSGFWARLFGK
jgi:hypothetical protein